jgi:hypothetical protein
MKDDMKVIISAFVVITLMLILNTQFANASIQDLCINTNGIYTNETFGRGECDGDGVLGPGESSDLTQYMKGNTIKCYYQNGTERYDYVNIFDFDLDGVIGPGDDSEWTRVMKGIIPQPTYTVENCNCNIGLFDYIKGCNNNLFQFFIDENNLNMTFTGIEENGIYIGEFNYYQEERLDTGIFNLHFPSLNLTFFGNYTNGLFTITRITQIQNRSDWNEMETLNLLNDGEYIILSASYEDYRIININTEEMNLITNILWIKLNESICYENSTKDMLYHHKLYGDNYTIENCTYVAPVVSSGGSSGGSGGSSSGCYRKGDHCNWVGVEKQCGFNCNCEVKDGIGLISRCWRQSSDTSSSYATIASNVSAEKKEQELGKELKNPITERTVEPAIEEPKSNLAWYIIGVIVVLCIAILLYLYLKDK